MVIRVRSADGELTAVFKDEAAEELVRVLGKHPDTEKQVDSKSRVVFTSRSELKLAVLPELEVWFWTGFTATVEDK